MKTTIILEVWLFPTLTSLSHHLWWVVVCNWRDFSVCVSAKDEMDQRGRVVSRIRKQPQTGLVKLVNNLMRSFFMFSLIPVFISHRFCFISSRRSRLLHPLPFLPVCFLCLWFFSLPSVFVSFLSLMCLHLWNHLTSLFGWCRLPIWRMKLDSRRFNPEAGNTQDQKGQTKAGSGHWSH